MGASNLIDALAGSKGPCIWVTSSFLYTRGFLCPGGYDYDNVKRWASKDGFKLGEAATTAANTTTTTADFRRLANKMLVPINEPGLHWTLLVVDFDKKIMTYCDSWYTETTVTKAEIVVANIKQYIQDEFFVGNHIDKEYFGFSGWVLHVPDDLPQQVRGSNDCGVFLCDYATTSG